MAKNHYIPQFIIRRFSDKVNKMNVFDIKKKTIFENMESSEIFYEHDIYDPHVEEMLNKRIEDPIARLLDKKIIKSKTITLTRTELLLLKKYMLITSIRTLGVEGYFNIISGFKSTALRYIELEFGDNADLLRSLPLIKDFNSPKELFNNVLTFYLETNSVVDMTLHEKCRLEFYVWAKVFLDGYINFWDANDNQEFILTDNGMTTEYEPSHIVFDGISLSKISYLLSKLKSSQKIELNHMYLDLLHKCQIQFENFSLFSISSSRILVLINPFFRLFERNAITINQEIMNYPKPKVWPTFIETKKAFIVPQNTYSKAGEYNDNDLFSYAPPKISLLDTLYINSLLISQARKIIGFVSFEKVYDSLNCAALIDLANVFSNLDGTKGKMKLYQNSIYYHSMYIFDHFKLVKVKPHEETYNFLEHYAKMAINDIKKNRYLLEYLLSQEEKLKTMSNFSFLGLPHERVRIVKKFLAEI